MTSKTHITTGLVCSLPFITMQNVGLISMAIIGAILPDVDLKLKMKHRSITHSIVGYLALSYGLFTRDYEIGLFFSIGYLTHLLLDMLTVKGIKLFYPLKKNIGLKLFKTDGALDHAIRFLGLGLISVWLLNLVLY